MRKVGDPREVLHVYGSGDLSLDSTHTARQKLGRLPSLIRLVEQFVVPFLYAATWQQQGGTGYPFEDLAHGGAGLLEDYECILGLMGSEAVAGALKALTKRPREANKLPCPCGCQCRLGRCVYRHTLATLKHGTTRKFFRLLLDQFSNAYPPKRHVLVSLS